MDISDINNTVLHQPNVLIYLKNTKIFFKILDKNPYICFGLSISHLQGVSHMLGFLYNILNNILVFFK
jgi:hypothetical protein